MINDCCVKIEYFAVESETHKARFWFGFIKGSVNNSMITKNLKHDSTNFLFVILNNFWGV